LQNGGGESSVGAMSSDEKNAPIFPKPAWIRVRASEGGAYAETLSRLRSHRLHTVCEEALCPNRGHCWGHGRATILILGDRCTRRCRFCHVDKREVLPPDPGEPARVAAAVAASGLREVVLTSVTRDDLPDGGAALWAETIRRVSHADGERTQRKTESTEESGNRGQRPRLQNPLCAHFSSASSVSRTASLRPHTLVADAPSPTTARIVSPALTRSPMPTCAALSAGR